MTRPSLAAWLHQPPVWLVLTGLLPVGRAHAERFEGPPPWRVGGRVGFTLDTAMFPDSTGAHLEVYLRVPPATLAQLDRDDRGVAQMRATVKVRPRGADEMVSTQEFALDVLAAATPGHEIVHVTLGTLLPWRDRQPLGAASRSRGGASSGVTARRFPTRISRISSAPCGPRSAMMIAVALESA